MANDQMVMLQGIQVPAQAVQPEAFWALTQRKQAQNKGGVFAGLGNSEQVKIRQQGIIAGIELRIHGTVTLGATPAVTPSYRWPFDLLKKVRMNVNGSSNLFNLSGAKLKARMLLEPDYDDRGVTKNVSNPTAAGTSNQGTLFLNAEDQGTSGANKLIPGQSQTVAGTYTVDLFYFLPVAADQITLAGAIFAQTAATELNLELDYASQAELFPVATNLGAIALNYSVVPIIYAIPSMNGMQILPDLSEFHSLIESRSPLLATGPNEVDLVGFGAGRKLLRTFGQVWNGAPPQVPLVVNATNYGPLSWRYGLNEIPEVVPNGQAMRYQNDRLWNADVGAIWGFWGFDFANKFAARDVVDGNRVTNLRLGLELPGALTNATMEYVQETLSVAPAGA